ncbi:E3 ubiquitin-protein ligase synoviolin-like, partial [Penaeus indicus]|uniref:E3 ubiquitin-protein ligase synoviolin-like n=1 Tax=Penaeus indicus TaxID=29960 RepID=UPI00300CB44F
MPAPMPVGALTMASFALTAAVIGNAYYQKKQFYPSVVYITKSNPSMAAIYLLAFTMVILLGKLLKKVFFGALRAAEFEHLIERSFYAVTETCLAFTVFRDDFSPKFVALFTVLLFLKAFHWLADYRVDFMERSPVITLLFHVRVTSLLLLLSLLDLVLVNHAYHSTITRGASVQLVFGFEYAILLTVALNIGVKYVCHTVDLQSENPWENKAMYLLYTELCMGFVKVVLYAVFMIIMIRIHTFPLFIIRPMYLTMRSFKRALNDVILSRRAIRNMNTLYPDATPEELRAVDNVCIICREEMLTGAKKLPCGHIFHASCLRSWFQRQQTCPTCRMDILRQPPPAQGGAAGAAAAARNPQQAQTPPAQPQTPQPQQQQRQAQQQMPNPFAGLFAGMPMPVGPPPVGLPPFPFPPMPMQQAQQQQAAAASASASTTEAGTSSSTTTTTSASTSSSGKCFNAASTVVVY